MKTLTVASVAALMAMAPVMGHADAMTPEQKAAMQAGAGGKMTPAQKKKMMQAKMQKKMAAMKGKGVPTAPRIYDPTRGQGARNLARGDAPLCANWRGGPKGTLMPMGMKSPPYPMMPGTHGVVGLSYADACERGEAFLSVGTRARNFFVRGQVYLEDVGTYTAPDGSNVDNSSDRLSYGIGAGWIGQDGSFLSVDLKRLRRDKISFAGNGAGADTRQLDVDRQEIAGRFMLDNGIAKAINFKLVWGEMKRVNDNYTYRPATSVNQRSEVRLKREFAKARVAVTGGNKGFGWKLGLEHDLDRRDATRYMGPMLNPQSPNYADAEVKSTAITADGTWALGEGRGLKAGLRVDFNDATLGGMDRGGMMTGMAASPTPRQLFMATYGYTGDGSYSETNLGGYLRYEQKLAGAKGKFYAGLSHKTRAANPMERYFTSFTPAMVPQVYKTWIGNPGLKAERHTMLEAGIGGKRGPWTFAGRAYGDYVQDFILWDRAHGQAGVTRSDSVNIFRNVDAVIAGLEGTVKYQFGNGLWAGADLWLTHGENTTDNRAIAQIPPAEMALKLGWAKGQWALQGRLRMVAKQSRLDQFLTTGSGQDGNGMGAGLASGYSVLDMSATFKPRPNMAISFGVENLLDQNYVSLIERTDIGDPMLFNPTAPGRTVWAKATFRF